MEKTKIEWCDSSWSPVSGCLHGCPYCFARGIATRFGGCDIAPDGKTDQEIVVLNERLKVTTKAGKVLNAAYPYGFTPTLHEYRLNDLKTKRFGKTIFVCSTADLFGKWVPDEWIDKVFNACLDSPEHRYLFLTKNPARYEELAKAGKLPCEDNFWYGSTATDSDTQFFWSDRVHTFLSIEPLLKPFERDPVRPISDVDWFIIGAETGNRAKKVVPEKSWIEFIVQVAEMSHIPVFMKDSLKPIWGDDIITQFPWE